MPLGEDLIKLKNYWDSSSPTEELYSSSHSHFIFHENLQISHLLIILTIPKHTDKGGSKI